MPYTYLLGWPEKDKWYYGVRYSKKSDPKDLWVTYFTSSSVVKNFYNKYGDPAVIEIRKIFESEEAARNWEHKVLKRLGAAKKRKWLNLTDNKSIPTAISSTGFWSEERRHNMSLRMIGNQLRTGSKDSLETLARKRISHLGKKRPDQSIFMKNRSINHSCKKVIYQNKEYNQMKDLIEEHGLTYYAINKMKLNKEIEVL